MRKQFSTIKITNQLAYDICYNLGQAPTDWFWMMLVCVSCIILHLEGTHFGYFVKE